MKLNSVVFRFVVYTGQGIGNNCARNDSQQPVRGGNILHTDWRRLHVLKSDR